MTAKVTEHHGIRFTYNPDLSGKVVLQSAAGLDASGTGDGYVVDPHALIAFVAEATGLKEREARWRWVLRETGRAVRHNALDQVPPERADDIDTRSGPPERGPVLLKHLAWLTKVGSESGLLKNEPEKAMRWAAWAQGALVALGLLKLSDCKRLCTKKTWEESR